MRCRALERENGLLLVADREHRAHGVLARTLAGGKFRDDVLDNVPLPRTGVLRFVDQDMIDAAVELVMHPAGRDLVQHRKRLVDQIVIVEQAALVLFAAIVHGGCGRDMQQRLGAVAGDDCAALLDQGSEPHDFILEQACNGRICVAKPFGQHGFAGLLVPGEKHAEIFVDLRGAGKSQRGAQLIRLLQVGLAAAVEGRCDLQPPLARQIGSVDDLALGGFDAVGRAHAKRGRYLVRRGHRAAGGVGPGHEMIAGEASLTHHILEGDVGGIRHRVQERAAEHAIGRGGGLQKNLEIGALHHVGLVALVEHGKARWHIGLERELLQQPRAQRVDGLHLQAARRLQRLRKQLARCFTQLGTGVRHTGVDDCGIERGIVEHHPVAERCEHALGHVGGGGLGEGDAEDLFRRHAGQQQADHALHQHVRFA